MPKVAPGSALSLFIVHCTVIAAANLVAAAAPETLDLSK
jgi:hypothetical protein